MRTIKELIYVLKMYGMPCHGEEKSVMQEAAEALETLQQELQDERHRHDRYVDFELAQAEELRKLKDQTRWIPVTERLPEIGDRCLCKVKSLAFPGSFYHAILRYEKYGFVEGGIYTDDVTHWTPLPEPPKEGLGWQLKNG